MHKLFKKCNISCFGVIFVFIGLVLSKNFEIGNADVSNESAKFQCFDKER